MPICPAAMPPGCGRHQSAASPTASTHLWCSLLGRLEGREWSSDWSPVWTLDWASCRRAQNLSACSSCCMTSTTRPSWGPLQGWRSDSLTTSHISLWRASWSSSTSFTLRSPASHMLGPESLLPEPANRGSQRDDVSVGGVMLLGVVEVGVVCVKRAGSSSHSLSSSWMCVSASSRSLWLTNCRISNTVRESERLSSVTYLQPCV